MNEASQTNPHGVDLYKILVKTTYLGLAVGFMPPGAYIIMAYMMNTPEWVAISAERYTETKMWIFIGLAVISAIWGIAIRKSIFKEPYILSKETFSKDFERGVKACTTILAILTGSIAVYGMMSFMFGGGLRAVMMFSIFSVIIFQLIRPRIEVLEDAYEKQTKLVSEGRFSTKKPTFFSPFPFKWP